MSEQSRLQVRKNDTENTWNNVGNKSGNESVPINIRDASGNAVTVTGGKLDVNATASLAGETLPVSGATEGVPVAIVDASGNQITSFGGGTQYTEGDTDATIVGTAIMFETNTGTNAVGVVNASNPLPVSATIDTTGLATTTTDTNTTTIAGDTTSIDAKIPALGQALAAASTPVVLTAAQVTTLTPPAAITGFATSAKQDTIIGHVDGLEGLLTTIDSDTGTIATEVAGLLTDTELRATAVPVSVATIPSHAVTNAGVFAVQATEADGANVTLGAKADAKSTATDTTAISAMSVLKQISASVQAPPSQVVTATDLDIRNLTATDVITAELSATDNAVLDDIASDTEAIKTSLAGTITVTGGGGGTEYTEDVATANPIVGTATMIERDDALTTVTPVEGDNIGLRGTAEGALWTQDFNSDAILADTTAILADTAAIEIATEATQAALETVGGLVVNLGSNNDVTVTGSVTADLGANNDVTVTSGAITETNSGGIQTAVQLIDDAIYVDDADWTDSTSKHALVGGLYQSTPQTVTDGDVAPLNITANGALHVSDAGGSLTVDGTVAVTGVSTAANQTTIIGHVDGLEGILTTMDADTGGILTAVQALDNAVDGNYLNVNVNVAGTDAVSGSGTATGALRVELPTNGTGVIATVGAVTAITNALPAGTNAIGKLAANSGVDIGDVTLTAGTAAIGTTLPPDIDITTHTNYARKYYTNAGAVTDGIIWSPAAGKRWHITTLKIQVSAAATVTLEDDLAGGDSVVDKYEFAANSGITLNFDKHYPLASGEDAADLIITTTAGNVYVLAVGYEI